MPFYRFILDSPLPPAELIARIQPLIREPSASHEPIRLDLARTAEPATEALFVGSIDFETFQVHRIFRGRNSFVPYVFGRAFPRSGGSRLRVWMFMHQS